MTLSILACVRQARPMANAVQWLRSCRPASRILFLCRCRPPPFLFAAHSSITSSHTFLDLPTTAPIRMELVNERVLPALYALFTDQFTQYNVEVQQWVCEALERLCITSESARCLWSYLPQLPSGAVFAVPLLQSCIFCAQPSDRCEFNSPRGHVSRQPKFGRWCAATVAHRW